MEMTQRKVRKKLRGKIGRIRHALQLVTILFYTLILLILALLISIWIEGIIPGLPSIISVIIPYIGYFVLVPLLYPLKSRYYIRRIIKEEYEKLNGRNLIHYTDHLFPYEIEEAERTGIIRLIANSSARSNYNFKFSDATKKFVWFHPSRTDENKEPKFNSFWYSHYSESDPRDYKIIVNPMNVDMNRIFIRPIDGAIVIEDDYTGEANIEKTFNWYNSKIYFWRSLCVSPITFGLVMFIGIKQLMGSIIDRKRAIK
ncbi:hypothetical protein HFE03_07790 [Paenibacillus sp. EKM102P]|uniref:hypothetical protein n=1 Tax=unclassified Paenibacillus TaxID=185978 RepID=UPI00142DB73C|nr:MULTISPECIES: hypothetical protein [unclassified Paenibacillus]KAF6620545.1 hypothetical protein HFE00_05695 [Paenibacillus sp. EKM101P]KAF6623537.1 hypothetical protein HFE03_07790 [Paenibacillus sp. EKM102P]KAF6633899.1 hypothetical protein HFE01_06715 [Paenibacillus sp. EKM10P]KAF6649427.1 hypothetical protein HFE02_01680 [Paenibacillus sp. EKM11P]